MTWTPAIPYKPGDRVQMPDGSIGVISCHPRKRFASSQSANAAAASIAHRSGVHRLPVPCSVCNGWHLETVRR